MDYINSFLPAATIEPWKCRGQSSAANTIDVFRVTKGVYEIKPGQRIIFSNITENLSLTPVVQTGVIIN